MKDVSVDWTEVLNDKFASSSLQIVKDNALKLRDLRSQKDDLNAQLKGVNESIRQLEEHDLDSLMSDMGITDITIDDVRVKRGVAYRGGVTSHTDKDAFKYLFDSHNDGALKQHLIVDLATQPEAIEILEKAGVPYKINYSIHPSTLSSLLKDLFEDGTLGTADFEKYSIYAQPRIKVELK